MDPGWIGRGGANGSGGRQFTAEVILWAVRTSVVADWQHQTTGKARRRSTAQGEREMMHDMVEPSGWQHRIAGNRRFFG
jgi:hypothetical protein